MSNNRSETIHRDDSLNYICVMVEDTGKPFDFYHKFLRSNIKNHNMDIFGVGGATNFACTSIDMTKYNDYIIIFDNGVETKKLNKIHNFLVELRKKAPKSRIYTFSPECFEHILISFEYLSKYIGNNIIKETIKINTDIIELMQGYIDNINYNEYSNDILSNENKIEKALEELTINTVLEYRHFNKKTKQKTYISPCWLQDCCQIDAELKNNNIYRACNKQIKEPKIMYIMQHSLGAGLLNIFCKIDNKSTKYLKRMNTNSYARIVGEV